MVVVNLGQLSIIEPDRFSQQPCEPGLAGMSEKILSSLLCEAQVPAFCGCSYALGFGRKTVKLHRTAGGSLQLSERGVPKTPQGGTDVANSP